jgi:hypothetical protein
VGGIARELKGQVLEAGGAPDHLHLATALHPTAAVAGFVGKIKGGSGGWRPRLTTHRPFGPGPRPRLTSLGAEREGLSHA